MWKRWLAAACLLLVAAIGTAQAVHIHGDWLPHNAHELHSQAADTQSLGGEEHCPLCVAMHSALPVQMAFEPVILPLISIKVVEREALTPAAHWHFAMFSRPPPALLS